MWIPTSEKGQAEGTDHRARLGRSLGGSVPHEGISMRHGHVHAAVADGSRTIGSGRPRLIAASHGSIRSASLALAVSFAY
jgi:hypothetical protein